MSTLGEITKEKQRVSEALARVEAQREKLAGQLVELEATERVLACYSKGSGARKTASARTPMTATNAAAPARARGRRDFPAQAGRPHRRAGWKALRHAIDTSGTKRRSLTNEKARGVSRLRGARTEEIGR